MYTVHISKPLGTACNCEFCLKLEQTRPKPPHMCRGTQALRWAYSKPCDLYGTCSALNTLQEAKLPIYWAKRATF